MPEQSLPGSSTLDGASSQPAVNPNPEPLTPPDLGAGYSMPYPPYIAPQPRPKKHYPIQAPDMILALAVIVLGYLAWDWFLPRDGEISSFMNPVAAFFPGVVITIYFILAVGCSLTYFAFQKVRLNPSSIIGAAVILLTALTFSLFDTTPVHVFAGMFLLTGYVVWHGYVANTALSTVPNGMFFGDVLNQSLVVPFSNAGSWFAGIRGLMRGNKTTTRVILALVGVLIALPVIAIVLILLMSADANFQMWMENVGQVFIDLDVWGVIWKLSFAFPVGLYLFALMYGNAHKMGTDSLNKENLTQAAASTRKISLIAISTPMALLCVIYVVFFSAMGSYFFLAFQRRAELPPELTYAEFARRGFFELAVVAGINLGVLVFTYLFANRKDSYPRVLRILGAALSGLTILLIVTSISKMLLYVDQYGLTRLRVYTTWFMCVLFIIFVLLFIWHIRQFKIGTPIIGVTVVAFLALTWANTDAMIANYNVNAHLTHGTSIDVYYLAGELSDAAVPALVTLRDETTHSSVRAEVVHALADRKKDGTSMRSPGKAPWTAWNWQSSKAKALLE
ncbi:MAG: DUF4173 domain-containing protein [Propionibacteriaceae bacterium]|nr:DUF4173 domain-containing protein [Propionibacteriaceae bacterium]